MRQLETHKRTSSHDLSRFAPPAKTDLSTSVEAAGDIDRQQHVGRAMAPSAMPMIDALIRGSLKPEAEARLLRSSPIS